MLKKAREARKISQEKLAEMISMRGHTTTGSNVSMIEREYDRKKDGSPTQPDKNFVRVAALVLGMNVDDALVAADYAPESWPPANNGMYSGLDRVPPDRRDLARRQIEAIIDSLAEEEHPDTDYISDEEEELR